MSSPTSLPPSLSKFSVLSFPMLIILLVTRPNLRLGRALTVFPTRRISLPSPRLSLNNQGLTPPGIILSYLPTVQRLLSVSAAPTMPRHTPPTPSRTRRSSNGAGDAFAGGLIGALEAGTSLDETIEVGYTLGTMCVTQVGPQYKRPKLRVF